jgi:hypothetical protein
MRGLADICMFVAAERDGNKTEREREGSAKISSPLYLFHVVG